MSDPQGTSLAAGTARWVWGGGEGDAGGGRSIKEAGAEAEIRGPEEGVARSRGTEGHAPGRWETAG